MAAFGTDAEVVEDCSDNGEDISDMEEDESREVVPDPTGTVRTVLCFRVIIHLFLIGRRIPAPSTRRGRRTGDGAADSVRYGRSASPSQSLSECGK